MTYVELNDRTYRISDGGAIHGSFHRRDDATVLWRYVSGTGPVARRLREIIDRRGET